MCYLGWEKQAVNYFLRLVYGCYKIYPENAETIHYVAITKRKVLIFFSQPTQLKFTEPEYME